MLDKNYQPRIDELTWQWQNLSRHLATNRARGRLSGRSDAIGVRVRVRAWRRRVSGGTRRQNGRWLLVMRVLDEVSCSGTMRPVGLRRGKVRGMHVHVWLGLIHDALAGRIWMCGIVWIGKRLFSSVAIVPRNVDGVNLGYRRQLQLFGISTKN